MEVEEALTKNGKISPIKTGKVSGWLGIRQFPKILIN